MTMPVPKERVVLITGGSAGAGAAIARAFAPDCRLVINYANNLDRAEKLRSELEQCPINFTPDSDTGPRVHLSRADVSTRAAVLSLVADTVSTFGRLDVVVSNAGWTRFTTFADLDQGVNEEDWDQCFAVNVKSHLWLMHAAREYLEKAEGAFVCTASTAGVRPGGSSLPYSITKAAEIHLVKALAMICSPKIRVNAVSPGLLETDWGMKFSDEAREAVRQRTPLKRIPTVEDVADQVRTLAFSRSITGQNVIIDGGFSM